MTSRLALGTAQFGLAYGVANRRGQISLERAGEILECARDGGLDTLDTAVAYGDSEARLGELGAAGWRVVTKLPAIPADCGDVSGWVERCVCRSLERLKMSELYGVLLHRPRQLLESGGAELYRAIERLRSCGKAQKIGVSIYDPQELEDLGQRFRFDIVQAPFNVFDRRLETTGWLERLGRQGVEVHTRSAFLQGLLLLPRAERPQKFQRWNPLWEAWDGWLAAAGLDPVEACLGFALRRGSITRVVVGVDGIEQLLALLTAEAGTPLDAPRELATDDRDLIDPSRWSEL